MQCARQACIDGAATPDGSGGDSGADIDDVGRVDVVEGQRAAAAEILSRGITSFCETEVSNGTGDLRSIIGAGDRHRDVVCRGGVGRKRVVSDGDRVRGGDGFTGR